MRASFLHKNRAAHNGSCTADRVQREIWSEIATLYASNGHNLPLISGRARLLSKTMWHKVVRMDEEERDKTLPP